MLGFADGIEGTLTALVGQLGVTGVLVWYLWHVTTRELPQKRRDFLEALHDVTSRNAEVMGKVGKDLEELRQAVTSLAELVRSTWPRDHGKSGSP